MSDYIPIDCTLYNRYELAIMHRQKLRLTWCDPKGNWHLETVLPLNLQTRHHAEYLQLRTMTGAELEIRLDQIRRVDFC
jgi:transcriptional antiterminator Rof (Rho-off)